MSHVIDVDVVAEDFTGAFVFGGDRGSGKADIGCVGKAVADLSCGANGDFSVSCVNFCCESILAAVGFVGDEDNVPPF